MSTFNGIVKEFPSIRIDQFRTSPDPASTPPLAFFLSHVHSDHLAGLETCKSPFIYCSPATKEILLRLEKYPHRMNFAKGILETRKQTYKHLRKLLKAIPLDTPTQIDLTPDHSLRVTLLDANHCVGAVMFLVEGHGKAILYTGDIRSEIWWVNALTRHPMLLPYVRHNDRKPIKQLDCVYLDTTFASKGDRYKHFQPKQEGLTELLQKVAKYPDETVFYFDSWTFGYEDVWIAISGFLGCRIHVDNYRFKLYSALVTGSDPKALEGPGLVGFTFGNHLHRGCLTEDATARLHSCEQGTGCDIFKRDFVRITPIISRHNGTEIAELGAGGGQGDLDRQHELEVFDLAQLGALMKLCTDQLHGQPKAMTSVMRLVASLIEDPVQTIALDFAALLEAHMGTTAEGGVDVDPDELSLSSLVPALVRLASKQEGAQLKKAAPVTPNGSKCRADGLPARITFPYSRHSSYTELCHLLEVFKPTDVHPCTVNDMHWGRDQCMAFLFGHLYDSVCNFTHDRMMLKRQRHQKPDMRKVAAAREESEAEVSDDDRGHHPDDDVDHELLDATSGIEPVLALIYSEVAPPSSPSPALPESLYRPFGDQSTSEKPSHSLAGPATQLQAGMMEALKSFPANEHAPKRRRLECDSATPEEPAATASAGDSSSTPCHSMSPAAIASARKQEAHDAALEGDWDDITLVSVSGYHQEIEVEL
ncbi:hypothetical protein B0A48_17574 [Cryoendolithus antarcticus]|uniref:Metallo-beta-lactamase domain-containing protein n=1 Tax=Cryoendolithus antarcticus TaxID=1507870 RepID=A0A1V8SAS7_9PEZI|nr:hypothetical protein B0A48_17574 [Cryoendolithus antarcticus]